MHQLNAVVRRHLRHQQGCESWQMPHPRNATQHSVRHSPCEQARQVAHVAAQRVCAQLEAEEAAARDGHRQQQALKEAQRLRDQSAELRALKSTIKTAQAGHPPDCFSAHVVMLPLALLGLLARRPCLHCGARTVGRDASWTALGTWRIADLSVGATELTLSHRRGNWSTGFSWRSV